MRTIAMASILNRTLLSSFSREYSSVLAKDFTFHTQEQPLCLEEYVEVIGSTKGSHRDNGAFLSHYPIMPSRTYAFLQGIRYHKLVSWYDTCQQKETRGAKQAQSDPDK